MRRGELWWMRRSLPLPLSTVQNGRTDSPSTHWSLPLPSPSHMAADPSGPPASTSFSFDFSFSFSLILSTHVCSFIWCLLRHPAFHWQVVFWLRGVEASQTVTESANLWWQIPNTSVTFKSWFRGTICLHQPSLEHISAENKLRPWIFKRMHWEKIN